MKRSNLMGFTLIELLIVVAIIAILAAIAVPNFLEAQIRSKVSREKANMRSLATALESYRIDNTKYPMDDWWWLFWELSHPGEDNWLPLNKLSTPVAHMSSIPESIFFNVRKDQDPGSESSFKNRQYMYSSEQSTIPTMLRALALPWGGYEIPDDKTPIASWVLQTIGPDMMISWGNYAVFGEDIINKMGAYGDPPSVNPGAIYDPTNGTISNGDIIRMGP